MFVLIMKVLKIMVTLSAGLVMLFTSSAAVATGLQVTPLSVELAENTKATEMWLLNTKSTAIDAQIRLYQWDQRENKDVLLPTSSLIISPPFTKIPPGGKQLVRVIRGKQSDNSSPLEAYRIVVNELPAPSTKEKGVDFVMEYSLPVFVLNRPVDKTSQTTLLSLIKKEGKHFIRVVNTGAYISHLYDIHYIAPTGKKYPLRLSGLGYVLPGKEMEWDSGLNSAVIHNGGSIEFMQSGIKHTQLINLR
ncbi:molecular chaperone [Enterobacter asburiae]|uniref:Pilus assembly protein n=1 Tax=Enterobacter asburiae TaxID=61645 RepID=A0A455W5P3_ENTAS|nr:fimbria/pilus periplasmic chaperone [Enterobacter asburiae]BBI97870.1 pilus assembly protein [Enterobacter asburiae]BBI97895.1 pilus assembly protein [Enterobacter asburiae]BBJ65422.1 pilus assembly protein [Enterobacter asburiae]HDX4013808.1 molecular chaperone [Enterobacter asburiae]HDX4013934.1 molecular chaperone [Enterobacter asburiae]